MRRQNSAGSRSIARGQRSFAEVPGPTLPRSVFNRDSQLFTGFKAGDLVPIFRDEVTPGDSISMNASFFGRLEPMIRPLMSGLYVDVFFFAVPHRLVWEDWQKMHGEQEDPGDSIDFMSPTLQSPGGGGHAEDSLFDYFGVPPGVNFSSSAIQSMFFRAYNLIWNEWFRDETLQDSAPVPKASGFDVIADFPIRKRGKRQDYFTSANPFTQKGNPVMVPIGASTAPVVGTGDLRPIFNVPGGRSPVTACGCSAYRS